MSYGQNAPWGLQPVRMQNNASWNQQLSPYLIASGYAQNIFKGDLVYISTDGYLRNLYDYAGDQASFITAASLGVFQGCSYAVPTAVNPIDPANPGHPYWPASTNTLGGVAAIGFVITDPSVVYNSQVTGATGAVQSNVRNFISVAYQVSGGLVQGNFNNGQSSLSVNIATVTPAASTPMQNCYIDALSPNVNNVAGQQYNNVEVMIANHYFRVMAALTATA
jgi:hypothetical protein